MGWRTNPEWTERRITDSAQRILRHVRDRAGDRGLHVVDESSLPMMVLWSILLWERKVGLVALERTGVSRFELVRDLDELLDAKATENPVVFDRHQNILLYAKTREPYKLWDFHAILEPLLKQAEREAADMGHGYLGSEHLMLAVIVLAAPTPSVLLQKHGVEHQKVKQAVLEVLGT